MLVARYGGGGRSGLFQGVSGLLSDVPGRSLKMKVAELLEYPQVIWGLTKKAIKKELDGHANRGTWDLNTVREHRDD